MSKLNKVDQKLADKILKIMEFSPTNISIYKIAICHSSVANLSSTFQESNERLEYLGDSILGAIVSDYFFRQYPLEDEGFLTEIRSRIVSRESLNNLAMNLDIGSILQYDKKSTLLNPSMVGNALEALIGAVYLDKGYLACKKIVIKKLIQPNFNLGTPITFTTNPKSKLIMWAQQNGKSITFETTEIKPSNKHHKFSALVYLNGEPQATGSGHSKKKAEQMAAQIICKKNHLD